MDKQFKAKWLKALKGNQFKQGKGRLRTKHGNHCCLGVACEVAGIDYNPSAGMLPTQFRLQIDLDYDAQDRLINLNDNSHGKGFKSVINYIEKNL